MTLAQQAAEWARDDRLWNTQEQVEKNLLRFVESVLAEQPEMPDFSRIPERGIGLQQPPSAGEWAVEKYNTHKDDESNCWGVKANGVWLIIDIRKAEAERITDAHNAVVRDWQEQIKRIADFAAEVVSKAKDLNNQLATRDKDARRVAIEIIDSQWIPRMTDEERECAIDGITPILAYAKMRLEEIGDDARKEGE